MKINQIRPLEAEFTEVLKSIAVMPKMLYFYGILPKKCPTVAIVGTRKNTAYGEEVAYKAAYELARRGVIVISGLAYGIDAIAHRGALDAGGVTVAVLGTAIDRISPAWNIGLAREIVAQGGCVMSEYGPGRRTYAYSFLERNRLIAGLSDAVLVVEANERSGSLNTAMHAIEQGRELFAVPGDITRPVSQGCNRLISQGATPYTGPEEILDVLFPGYLAAKRLLSSAKRAKAPGQLALPLGDTPEETCVLTAIYQGTRDGEEILRACTEKLPGFDVAKFNQTVTMLEIKGLVRALGANQWGL